MSKVTNFSYAFDNAKSLQNLDDLAVWNPAAATNMDYMFYQCKGLTNIDAIKNWVMPKLTSMKYIFQECSSITAIDIKLQTPALKSCWRMFPDCTALETVRIEDFQMGSGNEFRTVFAGCKNLREAEIHITKGTVTDASYIFLDCESLEKLTMTGLKTTGAATLAYTFQNCKSLTSLEGIADWDVAAVTNMSYLFDNCGSLTQLAGLENWNTGANKTLAYAFQDCVAITDLSPLAGWNVSKVTSMESTFAGTSLTEFTSLKDWRLDAATSIEGMFQNCKELTNLDGLADWAPAKVTNLRAAFSGCKNLTDITGIGGWVYTNTVYLNNMFYGTENLKTADLSRWTYTIKGMDRMFSYGTVNPDLVIDLRSVIYATGNLFTAPFPRFCTVYVSSDFYEKFFKDSNVHLAPDVTFHVVD